MKAEYSRIFLVTTVNYYIIMIGKITVTIRHRMTYFSKMLKKLLFFCYVSSYLLNKEMRDKHCNGIIQVTQRRAE